MDNKTKGVLEYRFPLPPFISELGRQGVPLSWDKINERTTQLFPKISHNFEMWGKGGRGELGETVLSLFCPSTVAICSKRRFWLDLARSHGNPCLQPFPIDLEYFVYFRVQVAPEISYFRLGR